MVIDQVRMRSMTGGESFSYTQLFIQPFVYASLLSRLVHNSNCPKALNRRDIEYTHCQNVSFDPLVSQKTFRFSILLFVQDVPTDLYFALWEYKKPKQKETIYKKKVTFTDTHGHFLSKKIVPWVADQGKNLEAFCEMWNEFKCLQEEWGFANGQGAGPAKFQVFRQWVDNAQPVHQKAYSVPTKL